MILKRLVIALQVTCLTMRMNMERNPLRQVTLIARYQGFLPVSGSVLPVNGGFRPVMSGVRLCGHDQTPVVIVSLKRLHVLALFELNTLLYGMTTEDVYTLLFRASPLMTP